MPSGLILLAFGLFLLAIVFVVLAIALPDRRNLFLIAVAVCVIALLGLVPFGNVRGASAHAESYLAPSQPTWSGSGLAHMGEEGGWDCDTERSWQYSDRYGVGSANGGTLGTSLPQYKGEEGNVSFNATVFGFAQARYYRLTLWSSRYGDIVVEYPFSAIAEEPGYDSPTGRLDVVGDPTPFYSGTLLRVVQGLWGGGGGAADRGGRIYIWCGIVPVTPPAFGVPESP